MPVAYSYIRFSSAGQRQGDSERRQGESPEPWCKANGYTLDTSLRLKDLGRSGYHGDNIEKGALGVFLDLVKDGKIEPGSVLLIEHLDRFTRKKPMPGLDHIQSIIRKGVDIVSLMDGERYSAERLNSDFTCLMKLMFILFQSNQESEKKSIRLKGVWKSNREKVRTGQQVTGRCPIWLDKKTRKPIPSKVAVIQRMFEMANKGYGPGKIAREFNAECVPVLGIGKAWKANTVKHHLLSRTALGEFQPCRKVDGKDVPEGMPVHGYYPAIIDRTLFLEVQQKFDKRKEKQVMGRVDNTRNLFTKLISNLYDEGRYHYKENGKTQKGKTYVQRRLIPYNRIDNIPDSMTIALDYETFETAFFTFVKEVDVHTLFTNDKGDRAKELDEQSANLYEADVKLKTLKERVKTSKDIDTILNLIEEIEADRKKIAKRVEVLKSELVTSESKIFTDMREVLDDPEARPKIASTLRLLIDRIDVLPIHTKTGQHRKISYLLYVEVLFNNGQVRWFVTDHLGTHRANMALKDGKALFLGYSVQGAPDRNYLIRNMIGFASDEWRERLIAKFGEPLEREQGRATPILKLEKGSTKPAHTEA